MLMVTNRFTDRMDAEPILYIKWSVTISVVGANKNKRVLGSCLLVVTVQVYKLVSGTVDHYVIVDADDSWTFLHDKVHFHLEDIL